MDRTTTMFPLPILAALTLLSACATPDRYPDVTDDGLVRIDSERAQAVYTQPGADLGMYRRIWLERADVQFRKDWQRDQSRSVAVPQRIAEEDMRRMRDALSDMFHETFTEELASHGYTLVEGPAEGVLRIRPEIYDLYVNAPELRTPSRVTTYTESAGEMTLKLELFDSVTGDLIAMGIDHREDPRRGFLQWQTTVANRAAAERILRDWARALREGLDEAMNHAAP